MYFEIDNTPEHIKRARRNENTKKESPKEECPRLLLAPFSRPPQVLFDNVLIGTTCERNLEVFNPTKSIQQVTLGKALPQGLVIHLPGEWLELEPETCYCLTMSWTPLQPTALRETIRFTNENRGRYDVIVILKSTMNIKGKQQRKGFKTSPGKTKKNSLKKSPVSIYKKKTEQIFNHTQVKKVAKVVQSVQQKKLKSYNMENICNVNDYSANSQYDRCPFDSPNSTDIKFDTSELFSSMKRTRNEILQQTYDKSTVMNVTNDVIAPAPLNVLKPCNRQLSPRGDIFDNLSFTPLKSLPHKNEKLEQGPRIIISMNSDCDDDSLENKENDPENGPHSIIYVTASKPSNKLITIKHTAQRQSQYAENTTTVLDRKIPNTSSPKEWNSPNFSINTEFSRISDLSFLPQRFSTERKLMPTKIYNETHDIVEDIDAKLSSDTYTKESPNMVPEHQPMYFTKDQYQSKCRQSLFREYNLRKEIDKNMYTQNANVWRTEPYNAIKSPPRSLTPPLQSIPEESSQQNSDTHIIDKTNNQMNTFTVNRTFDTTRERNSIISTGRQTWSKRDLRADPTLWKIPALQPEKVKARPSLRKSDIYGSRPSNTTFDSNKTNNQNISLNHVGNVYSQALTVDPFLSSTYFYDEEAVAKFEKEFKRWLNYILTPPSDLDCNLEQKMDVGKAWIENRNKEVPLAPTKEQVSSTYHNSHRLKSLRRLAKSLLLSPEICQVFQKLTAQIEKKLIVIRTDRNLHLDVGLQKVILELLLCYNPLWLRIGLEALYCLVLPLKSNNDIEGLTSFIIQRMFKNPFLKNKHSKSNAPNMLLPAYMEAIKKFTLKKFFMLVFFLDQAKQKKLIPHDPCLFRRNAICKESREVVIRFTRELIAGIGDITKHLRPLGYVVSHKQTYLDEYVYAVHNIAVDIRDGVRISKVMEIILMKNGLLKQLRTPAISRLQKIHNVQVALNALKEANFVIVGDISAADIADGHREKTMSLLWQLIHVFRAPLFETAANVIQTWWKKKYKIIVEKREAEEKIRMKFDNAARTIQCWWQRIQYNRVVERQMILITKSTITIQKYCRMWICRTRMLRYKSSVRKIEEWYLGVKLIKEARSILEKLRLEREELRMQSAIEIQRNVRRWLCVKKYEQTLKNIVIVQSLVRRFLVRKWYMRLLKATIYIQQKYRGKLAMKREMQLLTVKRQKAIVIQRQFRMLKQYRKYQNLKNSVKTVEKYYEAIIKMRLERNKYLQMKECVIKIQAQFRAKRVRKEYVRQRELIVKLQRRYRAYQLMKQHKLEFTRVKTATRLIQNRFRSYLLTKITRQEYLTQRKSALTIQRHYRSYVLGKAQRDSYVQIRNAAIVLQKRYRSLITMRKEKNAINQLRSAVIIIQSKYRALVSMRKYKQQYEQLRSMVILIQRKYRAQIQMKEDKSKYLKMRNACITIQTYYRAVIICRQQKKIFLQQKAAALKIQNWFRGTRKSKQAMHELQVSKKACVTIQRIYRAYVFSKKQRQEYLKIRTATIKIQNYFRSYLVMKTIRHQFIQLKTSTVTIQRFYRGHLNTKKQRVEYLNAKSATILIQRFYRRYKESRMIRQKFLELKTAAICLQRRYRSIIVMREARNRFIRLKQSVIVIEERYRAITDMRKERENYLKLRSAVLVLQARFRAQSAMKLERCRYTALLQSSKLIQRSYRAYIEGRKQRDYYMKLRQSTLNIQTRYRALLAMRKYRTLFLTQKSAALSIQKRYRAHQLMLEDRSNYINILRACHTIQSHYRAYVAGKKQKIAYLKLKSASVLIQKRYRDLKMTRQIRNNYLTLRKTAIGIQRLYRTNSEIQRIRRSLAAKTIQSWFRSLQKRNECQERFLKTKTSVTKIQSTYRMYIARKRFMAIKNSAVTIQRFYRSYKVGKTVREHYGRIRCSIIKLQAHVRRIIIRRRYLRCLSEVHEQRKQAAAVCIQKNVRRYLAQSRYTIYRKHVIYIQKCWRGRLEMRSLRYEYQRKRCFVIKLQAIIRGYLVRTQVEDMRMNIMKTREEQRRHWAACKIQAVFRGHAVRVNAAMYNQRVVDLRRRWREGALVSTQETLEERNEEAMDVLNNFSDMESIIKAFKSLELLTEVFPMMYNETASNVVRRVYIYMSVMNRSISSVEVLKSAASVLANLTRYRVTGPKIYARDRISPILKYMWRFSNSEPGLFLILCTYLWLFSKYEDVKEDLTEYLHMPENHRMMMTIKSNVDRVKRMALNATKHKPTTPAKHNASISFCGSQSVLPALEPDYGIARVDQPRYFENTQQAIHCLFRTYKL